MKNHTDPIRIKGFSNLRFRKDASSGKWVARFAFDNGKSIIVACTDNPDLFWVASSDNRTAMPMSIKEIDSTMLTLSGIKVRRVYSPSVRAIYKMP